MTTRRSFIANSALLSTGLLIAPNIFAYNKKYIGLQLYTVRDHMQADPVATLSKVAQIGYTSMEGATYTGTEKFYGMDAPVFSTLLKQNGLIMPSSHYRLGEEKDKGGCKGHAATRLGQGYRRCSTCWDQIHGMCLSF